MYYTTTDINQAQNLCMRIQSYLTPNRNRYNAICWMEKPLNNYSNASQYAVSLPEEYLNILSSDELLSVIDILPDGWFPVDEMLI